MLNGADGVSKRTQVVRLASDGVAGHERDRFNICSPISFSWTCEGQNTGSNSFGPGRGWGFDPHFRALLFDIVDFKEGMRGRRSPECRHRLVSSFGSSQDACPKCVSTLNAFV